MVILSTNETCASVNKTIISSHGKCKNNKNTAKMTTSSLLDIDVDSLFEQCSINEIDLVHKKLQQSIEAKKEELRIMVG